MDDPSAPELLGRVTGAQQVFFSLDADDDRIEHRLYFEQEAGLSVPVGMRPDQRPVVQVAFRWASGAAAPRTTTYVRAEGTDRTALEPVIRSAVEDLGAATGADVIDLWSRLPAAALEGPSAVLVASETGSRRSSIDVSLLGADLRVGDARSLVERLAPDTGTAWLRVAGAERLGRLGAGRDRAGRAYVTLYHDRRSARAPRSPSTSGANG